jgi:hypothetical protein
MVSFAHAITQRTDGGTSTTWSEMSFYSSLHLRVVTALRRIGSANTKLGVAKRLAGNIRSMLGARGQAWPLASEAGDGVLSPDAYHAAFYRLPNRYAGALITSRTT